MFVYTTISDNRPTGHYIIGNQNFSLDFQLCCRLLPTIFVFRRNCTITVQYIVTCFLEVCGCPVSGCCWPAFIWPCSPLMGKVWVVCWNWAHSALSGATLCFWLFCYLLPRLVSFPSVRLWTSKPLNQNVGDCRAHGTTLITLWLQGMHRRSLIELTVVRQTPSLQSSHGHSWPV